MSIAIFVGLLLSLSARFEVASALVNDISCLRSFKDSLIDPFGSLATWDFTNDTEGFICKFNGIECWHPDENKVLSIRLSSMGLLGNFPAGLRKCTSLTGLDISHNQLSGTIPSDINLTLPYVTILDLSNNRFSGIIPPSIANCTVLNSLSLDSNEFWGPIPEEIGLLPRMKMFNVSNNKLSGPVPSFPVDTFDYMNNAVVDYANNAGLCGLPLKACKRHSGHISLSPPSPFIQGLLTGWGVSMALVFFVFLYAIPERYVKKPTKKDKKMKRRRMSPSIQPLQQIRMNNTLLIAEMDKYITRVPFADLDEATGKFSEENMIGIGRKGKSYKATIQNGQLLAVKRLLEPHQQEDHIASEALTLGRLRHHRLVPLVGLCLEKNDMFFVYKYMPNGNLHDWLHLSQGEGEIMGSWPSRFKIAAGVAEGLAWLHHTCTTSVIHGALSSKCILLDARFEPKISNFWDAEFCFSKSDQATSSAGVYPRADFQELEGCKKDVYLFGVMLLELITRKNPRQLDLSIRNLSIDSLVIEVDEILRGQGYDDEILQCLEVAHKCVQPTPSQRPTMVQVYTALVG